MAQKYVVKTKRRRYFLFDKWMTALEMRAFGWKQKSPKSQNAAKTDGAQEEPKNKVFTFLQFRRIAPYTDSYFFAFLEGLMYIASWVRRTFNFLIWLSSIILIVCGILGAGGGVILGMDVCLFIGIASLVCAYIPSAFLCLCGWAYRKIFKVDEQLKINLEKNGYEANQDV